MSKIWVSKKPKKVFMYPTMLCNLHCKMCYSGGHADRMRADIEELDFEFYKKTIDELYNAGIRVFDISGGEPLLRKDILEICKAIKNYPDSEIHFVSNGTLICENNELVNELVKYIDLFKISLDSSNPDRHNEIRGYKGAFQKTEKGLEFLLTIADCDVGINFVVMETNIQDVLEMLNYVLRKKIRYISLLRMIDVSQNEMHENENVSMDNLCNLVVSINEWIEENDRKATTPLDITLVLPGYALLAVKDVIKSKNTKNKIKLKIEYDPIRGCPAFGDSIVMTNTGKVSGCTGMVNMEQFYIGDLKVDSLEEVYKKMNAARMMLKEREIVLRSKSPCDSCDYWNSCRGGCPAMAYRHHNSLYAIDPTCCKKTGE